MENSDHEAGTSISITLQSRRSLISPYSRPSPPWPKARRFERRNGRNERVSSKGGASSPSSCSTAARRGVEALPELTALLKKHKADAFARGHARPEDFVFTTVEGLPLMHRNVSGDFKTAGDRAGLNPKEGEEGQPVSLHDLRHTAACRLIAAGLDVVQVQTQLGHANPAITLSLYGGEFQVAQRRDALRDKIAGSGLGAVLRR
jgi:integrase